MTCCFCCVVLVWSTANRTLVESVAVNCASRCNNCVDIFVWSLWYSFCNCRIALCASLYSSTLWCAGRLFCDNSTAICVVRASAGEFVCLCYRRIVCRINFYSEWTAVFECDASDVVRIVFKLIYTYHTTIRKFNCVVCIVIKPEINAVARTELSFAQYAWKGRIRNVCAPINSGRGRNCELIHIAARLAGLCYSAVSFWCVLCFIVMACLDVNCLDIVKIWKVQGVEGHVIFIVNIPNGSAIFDNRLAIWKASLKGVYTAVYSAVSV